MTADLQELSDRWIDHAHIAGPGRSEREPARSPKAHGVLEPGRQKLHRAAIVRSCCRRSAPDGAQQVRSQAHAVNSARKLERADNGYGPGSTGGLHADATRPRDPARWRRSGPDDLDPRDSTRA